VLVASAASFDPATAGRDAALAVALAVLAGKGRGAGSGVLFLRMRANGQGLSDLGYGAGAARLVAEAERGALRAALVVGEDPVAGAADPARVGAALSRTGFLAVVDAVPSRTTEIASVVLPGTAFAEVSGTCTNSEGRVRLAQGALPPPGGLTTLEVLSRIGERLGVPGPGACPTGVRARVAEDLALLGFPAAPGRDGVLLRGASSSGSAGRVSVEVPPVEPPETVIDPRFSDALEVLFSRGACRLGLRAHVARPWPVSA
jgi:anaerobic selenocysteine-containing dehydrogenase